MNKENNSRCGEKFDLLVGIMQRLRGPNGCPWDREQTLDSLKTYLIEETYEVLESIDAGDWQGLAEELGDLMLQPVFLAQLASEQGSFSIADSLDAINNKLVRRHPHVFGDAQADTADEVKLRWDQIKAEEKLTRGHTPAALLDSVPRALPALMEAQQIGSKVARVGFDWPDINLVFDKLHEELQELHEARGSGSPKEQEQELGDLLFVITNLARFLKIDAEQALRGANAKFRKRFGHVERSLAEAGKPMESATLEEMEDLWQEAKQVP
ncbi:MAG: nucleoside triphosphate pyrophosphohydrolase [Acidobacteriia bacterium]|nr:nucleoside triphosphate pyrophosphohydrolase [Terriglobia bacterium]